MAHFYAFCQAHKKCGPNRQTESEAWSDVDKHFQEVSSPHGEGLRKVIQ